MSVTPEDKGGPDGGFLFVGPMKDGFVLNNEEILILVEVLTVVRAPEFQYLRRPLFDCIAPALKAARERVQ